ncbi:O-antigen ligase family protein [Devosia sp. PTR5]|uniref:O-antigen ligase family protein n=1 Tax=Devosia oryzisoli TaxID=2774138 RepID=A0A927IUJ9_9HYPH|nr:O-antigen ligase family protein [Devosia oryzisoli]MBD8066781.1 O-antigen ligase family protein [Devosia oryzisoli]
MSADAVTGLLPRNVSMPRAGRIGTLNDVFAVFLVLLVGLAALPLGSNRPFFWAFWPTVLGVLALLYLGLLGVRRAPLRVSLSSVRVVAILYGAVCIVLLVQLLPLGSVYRGGSIASQAGLDLHPPKISTTPGETGLMLLRWLGFGLLFFLTLQVALNPARRMRMLHGVLVAITAQALIGILSYYQWGNTILGIEKWAYLDSLTGTFVNRNSFATFMALGIAVTTGLAVEAATSRSGTTRLAFLASYGTCMVFLVAAVFGSNSRMGLLVSILGALSVTVTFAMASRRRVLRALGVALLALGIILVPVLLFYDTGVWQRFLELERSGQARLDLYRQIIDMIRSAPLLGFGGGSFEQAYQVFHRPPVDVALLWDRGHNTYLTLWSELGLVGGSLPLLLVAAVALKVILGNRGRDHVDPSFSIWIGAVVIATIHSLVDFSFEMFAVSLCFALLAALAVAGALGRRSSS